MVVNGNTNWATARPTVKVCWATRDGHFSTHASYSRIGPTCTSSTFWYSRSGTMAANDTSQMSTSVLATLHRNTEPRGFRTIVKYLPDKDRNQNYNLTPHNIQYSARYNAKTTRRATRHQRVGDTAFDSSVRSRCGGRVEGERRVGVRKYSVFV